MQPKSTHPFALVLSLVLALVLGACGGGDGRQAQQARQQPPPGQAPGAPTASADTPVQVTATNFAFALDAPEVQAGPVTFAVTNRAAGAPHDFALKGNGLDQKTAMLQPGQTGALTVDLKPGVYTYYCTVPGHDFLGMKGSLTVRP